MRKNVIWPTVLSLFLLLSACRTSPQPAATPAPEQMTEPEEENWSPYDSVADANEFILSNGLHPGLSYTEVVELIGEPDYMEVKPEYSARYIRYVLEYGDNVLTMGADMPEPEDPGIETSILTSVQLRSADITTSRGTSVGDDMDSVCRTYDIEWDGGINVVSENVLRLYGKEGYGYRNYDAAVDFCIPSEAGGYVIIFLFTGEELSDIMLRSNEAYEWPEAIYPPAHHEQEKKWAPYTSEYDMTDFILSNGLYLGMDYTDVVDIMGEPNEVETYLWPSVNSAHYVLFYDSAVVTLGTYMPSQDDPGIESSGVACIQLRTSDIATARGVCVGDSVDSVCDVYDKVRESDNGESRMCGNFDRLYGPPSEDRYVELMEFYDESIDYSDWDMQVPENERPLQVIFFLFTDEQLTSVFLRGNVASDWSPHIYPPLDTSG